MTDLDQQIAAVEDRMLGLQAAIMANGRHHAQSGATYTPRGQRPMAGARRGSAGAQVVSTAWRMEQAS